MRTVTPGECMHNPGKSLARNTADAPQTSPLEEWSVQKSVSSGYQVEMVTKEDVLGKHAASGGTAQSREEKIGSYVECYVPYGHVFRLLASCFFTSAL